MKAVELRKKGEEELKKTVHELKSKLSDIRFKFSSNRPKNVKDISNMKKEIARILTIINENKNIKK